MDIHPPIEKRSTEQLLEIIETREDWKEEVVRLTQDELIKRGVPVKNQETRRKIKTKFRERIQTVKSRATYTTTEKVLIVLFGPLIAIILSDIFIFQAGDGFKKKNRQGVFYFLLGIGLWGLTFYVISLLDVSV
jgi:hypothetical protein